MEITAIKTRRFQPPKDDLNDLIDLITPNLSENMIIVITSKVISICEGRCIKTEKLNKDATIKQESQYYIKKHIDNENNSLLTINNNVLVSSAGIDQSNGDGYSILLPENPFLSAQKIYKNLKRKSGIKNLGVIITDSHSIPLRRGAMGISIGFYGFEPLKDHRGESDLFGRKFRVEVSNFPDALAAAAVLVMGETDEQTPIALIKDLPKNVRFINKNSHSKNPDLNFFVDLKEDIFERVLTSVPWQKGGKSLQRKSSNQR